MIIQLEGEKMAKTGLERMTRESVRAYQERLWQEERKDPRYTFGTQEYYDKELQRQKESAEYSMRKFNVEYD
jgi:hypothetical protein